MKKNTKNGNQALTNVPFSKEISETQKLKKTSLPRAWWGPRQRPCAERGPSAQTSSLPTAPAGSRQRPVDRVKPGSTPLSRAEEGALGTGGICADSLTIRPSAKGYFRIF
jgi:hypothetical protein